MPIKNFEEITHNLHETELNMIPLFLAGFENKIGKHNAITNKEIIAGFKSRYNVKLTPPRIRKIINHIRVNQLIKNLCSTSKGYFIAQDENELAEYLESLDNRINEITRVRNSFTTFPQ